MDAKMYEDKIELNTKGSKWRMPAIASRVAFFGSLVVWMASTAVCVAASTKIGPVFNIAHSISDAAIYAVALSGIMACGFGFADIVRPRGKIR
jgi:hypothetical protein